MKSSLLSFFAIIIVPSRELRAIKPAFIGAGRYTVCTSGSEGGNFVLVHFPDEDGKRAEHWGTFNSVWRLNDDGQWRVVFDAGNPAAAAPDDATRALLDADDDCE